MTIGVMATQPGHYQFLREPGDKFIIKDERAFSHRWMKRIDGGEELPAKPADELAKQLVSPARTRVNPVAESISKADIPAGISAESRGGLEIPTVVADMPKRRGRPPKVKEA